MSRLDPGYSSWKGSILKHHNYAQLQLLKLQLEVSLLYLLIFELILIQILFKGQQH